MKTPPRPRTHRVLLVCASVLCLSAPSAADDVYEALAAGERAAAVVQAAGQSPAGDADVAPLLLPPTEYYEERVEVVPAPAPEPDSVVSRRKRSGAEPSGASSAAALLGRGLISVTIDAAPAVEVARQSEKIKEENRIRDLAAARFDADSLFVSPAMTSPAAGCSGFAWAAPALYHRPLLFEQPNVERYGHRAILCPGDRDTQSVVSGAHFFGSVAALPYLIGAYGCCEPEYVLGSYRPGSCNPHRIVKPRCSCRGLAAQAAATTGLVFVVP